MERKGQPHVVIIGAGFGGLWAAKTFFGRPVRVTLVDRNNYHTFFPLLYQVGAAEIEPEQIAYPVRTLLRKQGNVAYLRADAGELDLAEKTVMCNGLKLEFDYCIIAAGTATNFFNTSGAERNSFSLKSLDESMILRNHILTCFERASGSGDNEIRRRLLSFVVVGGGPTGIEFSGALAELINGPLKKDFPRLSGGEISVYLVEASRRLIGMFSEKTSLYAAQLLERKGVTVLCGSGVKELHKGSVTLDNGRRILSETVVWTAGVAGERISGVKAPLSKDGRVKVDATLGIPGYEGCYVAGDLAFVEEGGRPLPMIAPVAIQQGRAAARNVLRCIQGSEPLPFRYRDRGAMVTIGRNAAVARIGKREFTGFWAWIMWLLVHLMNLIGFRNKLFVMINWAWDYIFFEKSVRLILPSCCTSPDLHSCKMR